MIRVGRRGKQFFSVLAYFYRIAIQFGFVPFVLYLGFRQGVEPGQPPLTPLRTVIVLGSGGHTTEMIRLFTGVLASSIQKNSMTFTPRCYILAQSDQMSFTKLIALEKTFAQEFGGRKCGTFEVYKIPRSREVKQTYASSIYTTVQSILFCIPLMWRLNPDLLLVNGPGTCVPVCFLAFLNRLRRPNSIIFVESICRVKSLSLSALLLYYARLADEILVQWPSLCERYPRTVYIGRFC